MKRLLFLSLILPVCILQAELTVAPYGFVAYDHFYDTRQVVALRELFDPLFPKPVLPDVCCRDINARPDWNVVPIQQN